MCFCSFVTVVINKREGEKVGHLLNHVNTTNDFPNRITIAKHIKPESRNGTMLGLVAHAFSPSIQAAEAGSFLGVQDKPSLHGEFQAIWDYRETVSKENDDAAHLMG